MAGGPSARRATLARLLGWPARRLLDPRVQWTVNLVDDRLAERTEALERRIERHEERLEARDRQLEEKLASLRVDELVGGRGDGALAELTDELGRFLNWATGHQGYAAQAELWFNPPVALDHRRGAVGPRHVSERIVEPAFVFAALAGLAPPARILDVGGSESTVALSLAVLGHDVTVVDPRGYPLAHPRLRAAACRLDELDGLDGLDLPPFDAAVALSAIEHFGLDGYGPAAGAGVERGVPDAVGASDAGGGGPGGAGDGGGAGGAGGSSGAGAAGGAGAGAGPGEARRLDLAAVADLRRRVAPGGLLALTVPFAGEPSRDDFERVYDAAGLDALLAGWRVETARAAWHVDRLTWVAGSLEEPLAPRGVALVVARNDGP